MDKKQIESDFLELGYIIQFKVTDDMGRNWVARTSPAKSGGTTNYFSSLTAISDYLLNVRINRAAENGNDILLEKLLFSKSLRGIIRSPYILKDPSFSLDDYIQAHEDKIKEMENAK